MNLVGEQSWGTAHIPSLNLVLLVFQTRFKVIIIWTLLFFFFERHLEHYCLYHIEKIQFFIVWTQITTQHFKPTLSRTYSNGYSTSKLLIQQVSQQTLPPPQYWEDNVLDKS